jgi:hypothetical protein
MVRVPEHSAVVGGFVFARVIDVDIPYVAGQVIAEPPPARIAGSQEVDDETGYRVVLVVVMRNEGPIGRLAGGLVIGRQIAEVPPPVLVSLLTFGKEPGIGIERAANELQIAFIRIL